MQSKNNDWKVCRISQSRWDFPTRVHYCLPPKKLMTHSIWIILNNYWISIIFVITSFVQILMRIFKNRVNYLDQFFTPSSWIQISMVNSAVDIEHSSYFHLSISCYHFIMSSIDREENPLPLWPEEGCICINVAKTAYWADYHRTKGIFFKSKGWNIHTQVWGQEKTDLY